MAFAAAGADDTHTATVDWGDGTDPDDATVSEPSLPSPSGGGAGGGGLVPGTITDTHAYDAAGVYTATIALTDNNGATM